MDQENKPPTTSGSAADEFDGDHQKAFETYKSELEKNEESLGKNNSNLCPTLNSLATTCMKLKDFKHARVYAERLQSIAKEWKLKSVTKSAKKLIEEITDVKIASII
jgi:hypothetical protein